MANKIQYGLRNIHIFPITDELSTETTYGTPFPLPGAVNLNLEANSEEFPFYADDIVYFNEFSNNGYSGDLEVALINEDFETKILGTIKDTNGALLESGDGKTKKFAMVFEIQGDESATRHILYNVSVSRPGATHATKGASTEPKTSVMSLRAIARPSDKLIKAKIPTGSTGYATAFTKVYEPVITGV